MYEHYAIIKDGQVVEYPANPRVYDTGLAWNWLGGELAGETFVFCHNVEPWRDHTKNVVENHRPFYNPDTGHWYRGYDIVDASPQEIAQRVADQTAGMREDIAYHIAKSQETLAKLETIPAETQQQWDAYFVEMQAIEQQAGFPWDVKWPTEPHRVKRIKATVERI
jgi:hypothetical protein